VTAQQLNEEQDAMSRIGAVLLQQRSKLNKTRLTLSLDTGLSPQTIRNIECGKVFDIGILTIAKLARALGIAPTELGNLIFANETAHEAGADEAAAMSTAQAVRVAAGELRVVRHVLE
jgi:transcriptional regulator with XRE-family HTH domain